MVESKPRTAPSFASNNMTPAERARRVALMLRPAIGHTFQRKTTGERRVLRGVRIRGQEASQSHVPVRGAIDVMLNMDGKEISAHGFYSPTDGWEPVLPIEEWWQGPQYAHLRGRVLSAGTFDGVAPGRLLTESEFEDRLRGILADNHYHKGRAV